MVFRCGRATLSWGYISWRSGPGDEKSPVVAAAALGFGFSMPGSS
jgi:hypothetical protein